MDTFTPLVPKVEPDSDLELDVDPEYSPKTLQEDQKIEIVTKIKDELNSEELKEYADSRGQFEEVQEGSYIISKYEVVDESPDHFIANVANPEDPGWDCPICLKQLPDSMDLKEHLPSHFTSQEYKNEPQCPLCGQEFNRLAKVYSHIVAAHKYDRKGVEDDQDEAIEDKKHSDYSDKIHNQCPRCKKVFATPFAMRDHLRVTHSNDRPFPCSVCNKKFKRSHDLNVHIKGAHDDGCECETCGKKLSTRRMLIMHRRRFHTKECLFACSICEAKFPIAREMKRHMLVHSDERPFRCEVCGNRYKSQTHLRRHTIVHKNNTTSTHKCKDCGRKVDNWDQHQQSCIISKKKVFACVECPKSYETSKQLANHVYRYHVKDKSRRQCPLCKKMFVSPGSMKVHLKGTHSNESPFSCSLCEKTFKRSDALKWHVKIAHETVKEKEEGM